MLESDHIVSRVVISVVQVNIDTPADLTATVLMLLIVAVTSVPDTIVGDGDTLFNSVGTLTPLEIKDVVGHVIPVLTNILRIVELFVNAAWRILKLSAGGP